MTTPHAAPHSSKSRVNKKSSAKAPAKTTVGTLVGRAFGLATRALSDESSATRLLIRQHAEVKALFKKIENAPTQAEQSKLFEELARNLVAHDAIERELFYPACEKTLGMTDLLGEALVEHGVIEFCLYEADQARKSGDFGFKCQVLSEMVLHHVKEEERSFFPEVEKAMRLSELEALGKHMQSRFAEALTEDFRTAVHDNLKQVLAGALKPGSGAHKTKTKGRPAKVKPAKRRRAA